MQIETEPTVLRVDDHGTVRVGQCNVMFDLVVEHYRQGRTPAEIVDSFPSLKLADVHSAIAYYLRHPDEVQEYLDEGERIAAKWRARSEADPRVQAERKRIDKILLERNVPARG